MKQKTAILQNTGERMKEFFSVSDIEEYELFQDSASYLMDDLTDYLRLLSSFIEIVSDNEFIVFLENYITEDIISEQNYSEIDLKKIKNEIRHVLLTMNFSTIFTIILKTINSIGSEVVSRYFSEMLEENGVQLTPAYLLIKRGLEMQYEKQLAVKEIVRELRYTEMSNIAVSIMRFMVINHASRHSYNPSEKQRIEQLFKFKPNSILRREQQIKSLEP